MSNEHMNLIAWTLPVAGVLIVAVLMWRAKRHDDRYQAARDKAHKALYAELEERRRTSGWYDSQERYDAEFASIVDLDRWRSRSAHPSAQDDAS